MAAGYGSEPRRIRHDVAFQQAGKRKMPAHTMLNHGEACWPKTYQPSPPPAHVHYLLSKWRAHCRRTQRATRCGPHKRRMRALHHRQFNCGRKSAGTLPHRKSDNPCIQKFKHMRALVFSGLRSELYFRIGNAPTYHECVRAPLHYRCACTRRVCTRDSRR